jgi:hypothetical protein
MNEDLLVKVYERVGEIQGQLTAVLADHVELKSRVGKLESQWAKLMGMVAVVGLPFTFAIHYLKRKLS